MAISNTFYSTGEHVVRQAGPILVRKFIGVWNKERYTEYQADLNAAYEKIRGEFDRWITIVDFLDWDVPTFDIFDGDDEAMLACYRDWMGQGLVGECWVGTNKMILSLMETHIAVPDEMNFLVCPDLDAARKWVAEAGFDSSIDIS